MPSSRRRRQAGGMTSDVPAPPAPPGVMPAVPPPRRRRRGLVIGLIVAPLTVVALLVGAAAVWFATNAARATPPAAGTVTFENPVAVPPLAESHIEDGVRVFALSAAEGRTTFVPQGATPTLGYNGSYLGPTLVAERGEQVRVDVANALADTTTVH